MPDPNRKPSDLNYTRPTKPLLSPVVAVLCVVPGLFCWGLVLGLGAVLYGIGVPIQNDTHLAIVWILDIVGILVPTIYYLEQPKPMYLWINLVINVTGLVAIIGAVSGLFPHV
jgi:hypothetical protein